MRKIVLTLAVGASAALGLAACSSDDGQLYNGVPYQSRTAGEGTYYYGKKPGEQRQVVSERPAPMEQAPAEQVFRDGQRK